MNKFKILDCTLRDGGYYTNWDFNPSLVDTYIESCNSLPIEYLEIGYRSNTQKGYLGEYFYLPMYVIKSIKAKTNKKLVVILNEKDVTVNDLSRLLTDCVGLIDMVRIAIDPINFSRAIPLAKYLKSMGFEVGFNVMYMSTWKEQTEFLNLLPEINDFVDYFYMVDSYGGVYPEDVVETFNLISEKLTIPIGFHGHNNLELALINSLTAIECGASIIDATITGMGRGAGNLKTELLLCALNAKSLIEFDFNSLSKVVDAFNELQVKYEWGTNLPYMVSGANSLPQKEVMDWVGKRYYSFNSIIRALQNQTKGIQDNIKLASFKNNVTYEQVLIVGGGKSVTDHSQAIQFLLKANPNMVVIHASSKNALLFNEIKNKQFFCLVGNEGHRMEQVFNGELPHDITCILPPFPRTMGTYIPKALEDNAFEVEIIEFSSKFTDSHTAIALQTAIQLNAEKVFVVGYDGYQDILINQKNQELFIENEYLFNCFNENKFKLISLTASAYSNLIPNSIFSII